jgi:ribose transport system permease protein
MASSERAQQSVADAGAEKGKFKQKRRVADYVQQYGVVLAFLLMCLIFTVLEPQFLTSRNLLNVAIQSATNAVIALGMTLVIASAGIDLSVGSVVAFTGVVTASLFKMGIPVVPAIILGLGVGAVSGLLMGVIIAKGNIPPFIATLGGLSFFRGLALLYSDGRPIIGVPDAFREFGAGDVMGIPTPWIIVMIVAIITYFIAHRTTFGEAILAIGGNEEAARLSGINISLVKMSVYGISGLFTALGGMILTARLGAAEPIAGVGLELNAIAAVVIGGTSLFGGNAKILGTLIGALIMGGLRNGLTILGVPTFSQQVAVGIVVVLAVFIDQLSRRRT